MIRLLSYFLNYQESVDITKDNSKVKNSTQNYCIMQGMLLYHAGLMHKRYINVFNTLLVKLTIISTYQSTLSGF